MKTPRHVLAQALAEKSLEVTDMKAFGDEIAAYLLAEHRSGELDSLMRDIMQYRADHGIVEVIAVSAYPLTETTRSDIEAEVRREFPDAKQVIISYEHDASVMAGVRLVFANQQLDLTARNKLNQLKQMTAGNLTR